MYQDKGGCLNKEILTYLDNSFYIFFEKGNAQPLRGLKSAAQLLTMQPHVLLGGSLSHWEAQRPCVLSCPSLPVGRRSLVLQVLGGCHLPKIIFPEGVLSQWAWVQ